MAKISNFRVKTGESLSKKGFSLVELMCVIAIISILASVTAPSIVGMISGDQLTNNAYQLSGIAQQARSAAISQHTYVWVGFYSYTQNSAPAVMVASLAINSGLSTDLPGTAGTYREVQKPTILRNTNLATVANYSGLPGLDATDNVDAGSQTYFFNLSVPGNSSAKFTDVIVFGPDGEVFLPQSSGTLVSPTKCVGLGINASPSSAVRTAAIQIRGLSGEVSVFQQ